MTSVNSSILTGLMSTISARKGGSDPHPPRTRGGGRKEGIRTEALVADVEIPEVDAEVVGGDVGFLVRVDGDGVYVVCVGVGVDFAGDGGDDVVLLLHAGEAEVARGGGGGHRPCAVEVIRLCDDAQGLFKDLPELDRLV